MTSSARPPLNAKTSSRYQPTGDWFFRFLQLLSVATSRPRLCLALRRHIGPCHAGALLPLGGFPLPAEVFCSLLLTPSQPPQTSGSKTWEVAAPKNGLFPMFKARSQETPADHKARQFKESDLKGLQRWRFELKQGDLLFLPRGFIHRAMSTGTLRLSPRNHKRVSFVCYISTTLSGEADDATC